MWCDQTDISKHQQSLYIHKFYRKHIYTCKDSKMIILKWLCEFSWIYMSKFPEIHGVRGDRVLSETRIGIKSVETRDYNEKREATEKDRKRQEKQDMEATMPWGKEKCNNGLLETEVQWKNAAKRNHCGSRQLERTRDKVAWFFLAYVVRAIANINSFFPEWVSLLLV